MKNEVPDEFIGARRLENKRLQFAGLLRVEPAGLEAAISWVRFTYGLAIPAQIG
jgi:hypothetical protein